MPGPRVSSSAMTCWRSCGAGRACDQGTGRAGSLSKIPGCSRRVCMKWLRRCLMIFAALLAGPILAVSCGNVNMDLDWRGYLSGTNRASSTAHWKTLQNRCNYRLFYRSLFWICHTRPAPNQQRPVFIQAFFWWRWLSGLFGIRTLKSRRQ